MEEASARLALSRAEGVPQGALCRLLTDFASARDVLDAAPGAWRERGIEPAGVAALEAARAADVGPDREWLALPGRRLVAICDPDYPRLLRDLPDPPPLLYCRGDAALLQAPQLAVVGARRATAGGVENTRLFATRLAKTGLVITSGLAQGVDAAAHRAALQVGGATVAVCATGLDRVYPAVHRDLAADIEAHGLLVSEFPLGTPPRRQHFPRRNRIISGLSLGVLVVEAALHSGSLITARLAAEQGREVMAVPGSIHNPMSRGCHALIREGAKLVETVAEVVEDLYPLAAASLPDPPREAAPRTPEDPDHRRVLEAMGHDPVAVDQLVDRTGLTPEILSSILLMLELEGRIGPVGDGRYTRVGERS